METWNTLEDALSPNAGPDYTRGSRQDIYVKTPLGRMPKERARYELAFTRIERPTPPVSRIPPEILSYIFEIAVEFIHHFNFRDFGDGPRKCRTKLLLVCKGWYNIITGYPSLWSTICLEAPKEK